MTSSFKIRLADQADLPALRELIAASVLGLSPADYAPAVLAGAVNQALALDAQLVADRTYFAAEPVHSPGELAGCRGWSFRATLCGGDQLAGRCSSALDPATEAAKIRGIYIHPRYARRGLGTQMLHHCEAAAAAAGFRLLEMGSTLTGVALYSREGYSEQHRFTIPLANGAELEVVHMTKSLEIEASAG